MIPEESLLPKVGVVIPCRNEKTHISACINSVLQSDYPEDLLHVIVADGLSDDGTKELLQEQFSTNKRVTIIDNEKRTTPHALNLGIKSSDANYVMILGAHSEISKLYVRRCVERLTSNEEIKCCGGLLKSISGNHTTEVIAAAMGSVFGVGSSHFRTGLKSGYVDTVAFGMYPKSLFEEIGYFDEELIRNQDDEMSYRILKHGYKIYLDNHIYATYFVRSSLKKLAAQQFQYGYWKVYVNKKHKAITTVRQLAPLFFLIYVFTLPISLLFIWWLMPLLVYFTIAIITAISKVKRLIDLPLLLITFPVLHLSYGYGYLRGIIDFILLNKTSLHQHTKLTR